VTEGWYDSLKVGCRTFMGSSGPVGCPVSTGNTLSWKTDFSVVRPGWKICSGSGNDIWDSVSGGGCQKCGNCLCTYNYPGSYSNHQSCTATSTAQDTLNLDTFNTEHNYDILTVGGSLCGKFSGTAGPDGFIGLNEVINWHSDFSVIRKGWRLCGTGLASSLMDTNSTHKPLGFRGFPEPPADLLKSQAQMHRAPGTAVRLVPTSMVSFGPSPEHFDSGTKVISAQTQRWLDAIAESPWQKDSPYRNKTRDRERLHPHLHSSDEALALEAKLSFNKEQYMAKKHGLVTLPVDVPEHSLEHKEERVETASVGVSHDGKLDSAIKRHEDRE